MSSRAKTIIVEAISMLPVCYWAPASRIVTLIWPGFRSA